MARNYTLSDVCGVANFPAQTLRNWVTAGVISPAERGGMGAGREHRFSAVQVLAVASAARHRHEGGTAERAVGVVRFLSRQSLEYVEVCFREGRTFPVPAETMHRAAKLEDVDVFLPGDLIPPPDAPDMPAGTRSLLKRLDLKVLWDEVRVMLAKIDKPGRADSGKKTKRRRVRK